MKKILFATGNLTKGKRFSKGLLEKNIEVLTLKDLNLKLDIDENGKDVIENALIKARTCHSLVNMPVMGMDDSLYLEGVPMEKQPGLFVRRVNGRTLSDEEVLEHYISLVKQYGVDGKLNCKWVYGIAVIDEYGKESIYTWCKDDFYMVDSLSDKLNPGYPLNSISKYKIINKYFTDVTNEDLKSVQFDETDVIDFITQNS